MSADLSERIGNIPSTVQCVAPETSDDELRTLIVYGAWSPDRPSRLDVRDRQRHDAGRRVGIKEAGATNGIHGLNVGQIVALINSAVQHALNIQAWHTATGQTEILMPFAGSTGHGIMRVLQPAVSTPTAYVAGGADDSGVLVPQTLLSYVGTSKAASVRCLARRNTMSTVSIRRWTAQSIGRLDFPSDS